MTRSIPSSRALRRPFVSAVILLGAALTIFPGRASATLIYNNGASVFIGLNITQTRSADDFVLASGATVTDVRFFGSVFSGTFAANFSGNISWAFYNDSAGGIGSLISSGAVSGLTGSAAGSFFQVDFALNSPLSLAAGTYWLELHEGATLTTNDGSAITWSGLNNVPASNAKQGTLSLDLPSTDTNVELAFQLFDNSQVVPEPYTGWLVAAPLLGLPWLRRRG